MMTKRVHNSEDKSSKKQKLDDDIDALWGDDLDDSVLDDCINRATQVLNEDKDKLDDSVLPSYIEFKAPHKICSSTQFDLSIRPGTSKTISSSNKENVFSYEKELQRLQQECEEKVGEISILRSQLAETKLHMNDEKQKFQNDSKSKLNLRDKQIQSLKSELDFKNLEISNLKQSQKVVDPSKYGSKAILKSSRLTPGRQATKQAVVENIEEQPKPAKDKFHAIVESVYPLKMLVSKMVLSVPKIEKHVIENKLTRSSRNAIPYLKNQTVSTSVVVEKSRVDMEFVYPVMLDLAECTREELNMLENITKINKVVCVSLQLLTDLQELLEQIKSSLGTEDILEADSIYLKKNFTNTPYQSLGRDEMGMKSGLVIHFLAELIPHCNYFSKYIFGEKLINLAEQDTVVKQFPYILTKRFHTGDHFLNKLIDIAKLIGEIRKAEAMSTFLRSSLKVFTNICKLKEFEWVSELVCSFTRELIFLRPPPEIIFEITYLFREASHSTPFIKFLLNKAKNCSRTKNGVVYFNNDACRFYIFVLMFDRCIYKAKTIPLDVSLNLLSLMYNTYKTSFFIHHQNIKECECLPQLYKLEIEIIFKALEQYKEAKRSSAIKNEWDQFFKNKSVVKMLSLMAFHSYELIDNYIWVYSQFKEIERQLQEEGLLELDRLTISEEMQKIECRSFEKINF